MTRMISRLYDAYPVNNKVLEKVKSYIFDCLLKTSSEEIFCNALAFMNWVFPKTAKIL